MTVKGAYYAKEKPAREICELVGISRSGFYKYLRRRPSEGPDEIAAVLRGFGYKSDPLKLQTTPN